MNQSEVSKILMDMHAKLAVIENELSHQSGKLNKIPANLMERFDELKADVNELQSLVDKPLVKLVVNNPFKTTIAICIVCGLLFLGMNFVINDYDKDKHPVLNELDKVFETVTGLGKYKQ